MTGRPNNRRSVQRKEDPKKTGTRSTRSAGSEVPPAGPATVLTQEERRELLEEIARDRSCYPRDRIAAIRALADLDGPEPPASGFEELDNVAQIRRK